MRLLKLSTLPQTYLQRLYSQRLELAAQSYAEQHRLVMSDRVGWSDFWAVALRKLGYQVDEIIANVEPMQRRWAKENAVVVQEPDWLFQIAAAQIKAYRPELLFIHDYTTFTAQFLHELKVECDSIKLVVGWCGAQYNDARVFNEYDIVLSCIPELVQHFRENGHCTHHMNHAFEPRILDEIDITREPTVDFSFLGSIVLRSQFHLERGKLLLELAKKSDLEIWSDLFLPSLGQRMGATTRAFAYDLVQSLQRAGFSRNGLSQWPFVGKVAGWDSRPAPLRFIGGDVARRAQPGLFGLAMYQQLHDSKVSLNTHIDASQDSASNMRLYEATGVGTCLMTDWKPNLNDLFEDGKEVVSYRNAEECVNKVRYLLDHQSERREIARAGQLRTLKDHTFDHRARQFDEIIRGHLCKPNY